MILYQLCFYVPKSHLEQVKTALFKKGAGQLGHYDHCSWETLGYGQFRPLKNSHPFLGKENEIETVPEYKVEMLCDSEHIKTVLDTLLATHPYETPAYHVYKIETIQDFE